MASRDGILKRTLRKLDKLRHLAASFGLLLQEETRPVAIALFSNPTLIFHLGFDRTQLADSNWYQDRDLPDFKTVFQILDKIATLEPLDRLEFLIASGEDPMMSLQVKLDRQTFPLANLPSSVSDNLQPQIIYSFVGDRS